MSQAASELSHITDKQHANYIRQIMQCEYEISSCVESLQQSLIHAKELILNIQSNNSNNIIPNNILQAISSNSKQFKTDPESISDLFAELESENRQNQSEKSINSTKNVTFANDKNNNNNNNDNNNDNINFESNNPINMIQTLRAMRTHLQRNMKHANEYNSIMHSSPETKIFMNKTKHSSAIERLNQKIKFLNKQLSQTMEKRIQIETLITDIEVNGVLDTTSFPNDNENENELEADEMQSRASITSVNNPEYINDTLKTLKSEHMTKTMQIKEIRKQIQRHTNSLAKKLFKTENTETFAATTTNINNNINNPTVTTYTAISQRNSLNDIGFGDLMLSSLSPTKHIATFSKFDSPKSSKHRVHKNIAHASAQTNFVCSNPDCKCIFHETKCLPILKLQTNNKNKSQNTKNNNNNNNNSSVRGLSPSNQSSYYSDAYAFSQSQIQTPTKKNKGDQKVREGGRTLSPKRRQSVESQNSQQSIKRRVSLQKMIDIEREMFLNVNTNVSDHDDNSSTSNLGWNKHDVEYKMKSTEQSPIRHFEYKDCDFTLFEDIKHDTLTNHWTKWEFVIKNKAYTLKLNYFANTQRAPEVSLNDRDIDFTRALPSFRRFFDGRSWRILLNIDNAMVCIRERKNKIIKNGKIFKNQKLQKHWTEDVSKTDGIQYDMFIDGKLFDEVIESEEVIS